MKMDMQEYAGDCWEREGLVGGKRWLGAVDILEICPYLCFQKRE